jgi:hypothetical protein
MVIVTAIFLNFVACCGKVLADMHEFAERNTFGP